MLHTIVLYGFLLCQKDIHQCKVMGPYDRDAAISQANRILQNNDKYYATIPVQWGDSVLERARKETMHDSIR